MNQHPASYIVATDRIMHWAGDHPDRTTLLADCLARHIRHDWGEVDQHDWQLNDRAIACRAGRTLSAYTIPAALHPPDQHLWIITDDLDSTQPTTTLLWPSDY
jgi:hypothetical protein